jgi:hypothetical protein
VGPGELPRQSLLLDIGNENREGHAEVAQQPAPPGR